MRVPVILRVYTSLLVPVAGCGRFWAGLVALENNENSKGSFFELSGFGVHLDLEPASGKKERLQRTRPEEAKWKRYWKFYVTALEVFFRDVRPTRFESRDCPTLRDPTHERTLTKVRGGSCHRVPS